MLMQSAISHQRIYALIGKEDEQLVSTSIILVYIWVAQESERIAKYAFQELGNVLRDCKKILWSEQKSTGPLYNA